MVNIKQCGLESFAMFRYEIILFLLRLYQPIH